MPVIDDLKKKVPAVIRETPEFNIFLKELKTQKLKDKTAVNMYLDLEIKKHSEELKLLKKEGPTSNRKRAQCAERQKYLQLIKDKVIKHL